MIDAHVHIGGEGAGFAMNEELVLRSMEKYKIDISIVSNGDSVEYGEDFIKLPEEMQMSQKQFCAELGISSSAMSAWRNGSMPKPERIKDIEKCLGISFADYEKSDESDELREMLRDRQDLRILLHSAKDVPASSVYALISQIEKLKEESK